MYKALKTTSNHVCTYHLKRQEKNDELIEMHIQKGSLLIVQVEECRGSKNTYTLKKGELLHIDQKTKIIQGQTMVFEDLEVPLIFQCLEETILEWHLEGHVFDSLHFENDVIMDTLDQIKQKDNYTKDHSMRVADLAKSLAIAAGCTGRQVSNLAIAALAHDLGKVKIEDQILNKPSRLTDQEYAIIQKHVSYGYEIVKDLLPEDVTRIILEHHERLDGSGYPMGLKSEEICMEAKVLAVVDTYDAMHTDRPYKRGRAQEEIFQELRRCKNSWYDPYLVELFIGMMTDDVKEQ